MAPVWATAAVAVSSTSAGVSKSDLIGNPSGRVLI
jgi:hypothetical protein